ncbi:MAG: hypothetical protein E7258_02345 [Lachnospiraceae bacterium]|nr:hypothetical protein [Lachnospiraceae bacterium]
MAQQSTTADIEIDISTGSDTAASSSNQVTTTNNTPAKESSSISSTDSSTAQTTSPTESSDDAAARAKEIMDRLNREAAEDEAKKRAEIEAARRKAEEQDRLNSILKSTQRDISQYITEGMAHRDEQQSNSSAPAENQELDTSNVDDETLRKAQEIMDRLNREAAEDEAKKQAEIEAAKEFARKNNL